MDISVVIPVKDEAESLQELIGLIRQSLDHTGKTYELILVDDGSEDESFSIIEQLHRQYCEVKAIKFRRNFGKSAALAAGFEAAIGRIILTMDADLQDDSNEIPRFLDKLDQGYDLVSGWKKKRYDPVSKTLPSKLFNMVTSFISGVKIHDFGCGFKAYNREVIDELDIYGDLHRYIPALAGLKGFKICEIEVKHHPRRHGKSKYGIERLFRGFFDLLTVVITAKYAKRPLHFFGLLGLICEMIGGVTLIYLVVIWFMGQAIGHRPLLLFGILFILFGMQLISIGLVSEMVTKTAHPHEKGYSISKKLW